MSILWHCNLEYITADRCYFSSLCTFIVFIKVCKLFRFYLDFSLSSISYCIICVSHFFIKYFYLALIYFDVILVL